MLLFLAGSPFTHHKDPACIHGAACVYGSLGQSQINIIDKRLLNSKMCVAIMMSLNSAVGPRCCLSPLGIEEPTLCDWHSVGTLGGTTKGARHCTKKCLCHRCIYMYYVWRYNGEGVCPPLSALHCCTHWFPFAGPPISPLISRPISTYCDFKALLLVISKTFEGLLFNV